VDDISFAVPEGESLGLLGPNGAGKSTTISMVCGLVTPTSGDVRVAGESVRDRPMQARRAFGLVPQDVALYPTLTARENLLFWGQMYGLGGQDLKSRVDSVLDIVGLSDRGRDRVQTYSGGMKRRLNMAVGLMHRPRLLVLDEPTVGIDPQSRNHILETVKSLNAEGMSVLYTSHYMEEVEYLCDRILIMDEGRMMALGTLDELRLLVGDQDVIKIKVAEAKPGAREALAAIEGVSGCTEEDRVMIVLAPHGRRVLADIITVLNSMGAKVTSVEVREPDLENVFLHLTGKSLRD
jgi:ABC-2 type transport system ATP-binding protein